MVDTAGAFPTAIVHVADIQDCDSGSLVFVQFRGCFPWVSLIWLEHGYAGDKVARQVADFSSFRLEVVKRDDTAGWFGAIPERWTLEPPLSRIGRNRRKRKDFENPIEVSAALVEIA